MGADAVPEVVQHLFNREGIELGGGNSIVNANSWNASKPGYDVTSGPSMRMVVDLGNLDALPSGSTPQVSRVTPTTTTTPTRSTPGPPTRPSRGRSPERGARRDRRRADPRAAGASPPG